MKLPEHVAQIKERIDKAFDKHLSRLGLGENRIIDLDKLPEELHEKRTKIDRLIDSHKDEMGSYEEARGKAKEELTFTLFNRLAAIKVMEAHMLFPEIITRRAEHGDRSFGHKAWLEEHSNMRNEELEGFREYLKYEFDQLGDEFPLFHRDYPYSLLPYVIDLNEIISGFDEVAADPNIDDNIWQSDDILGWLYESYNNDKKLAHKESKAKTEYDKVSTQSQVYTPRWVVKFLVDNSLGKLYLEMFPDSSIKDKYQIANAPSERVRTPKKLTKIKVIDPACGSGNFELYAFDLFYDLYLDQINNYGADYEQEEIPRLIIEHNLHGIDLDDRAVQLAHLGLYIKAKRKNRNIGSLAFNVVSSDFFLPDYEEVKYIFEGVEGLEDIQKNIVRDTWADLQNAHKFGSLIRISERIKQQINLLEDKAAPQKKDLFTDIELNMFQQFEVKFFENLDKAVERYALSQNNTFLSSKTKDAITFLKLLAQSYDVAVANPPYTDSADFGEDLKEYIVANYKKPFKFHTNLFASFIKRCFDFTNAKGRLALVHPNTFMFIKSFEGVRKFIIEKTIIDLFVDHGQDRINVFDSNVSLDVSFYILNKSLEAIDSIKRGTYIYISNTVPEKEKKELFENIFTDLVNNIQNERVFNLPQSKLKIIKSYPFIYWISDEFRKKFELQTVDEALNVKRGCETSNNNRFLKFWWEIPQDNLSLKIKDEKEYLLYAKGGPFRKWAGNLWITIDFRKGSYNYIDKKGNLTSEDYYYKKGVTYSGSGSKGPSFRLLPENTVFDVGGSSIFPKKYKNVESYLSYFNSKLTYYLIHCLNPTVNTQIWDIKRLPFVIPSKEGETLLESLSSLNIKIKNTIDKYSITNPFYSSSPFYYNDLLELKNRIKSYFNFENYIQIIIFLNELVINEKIFEVYELTEADKNMVLAKEGHSIAGLHVTAIAKQAYLSEHEFYTEFPLDNVKDFILSLPEKEFIVTERESIEKEFQSLYQSNNDLEEFCIRHQVNPINVWYWFKESNVIPKQRMNDLAMEFLADMIRELLIEDDDGIIPLVPNAGEKVLLDRIEEKFIEKGFSMAQYSSFHKVLGRELSDHLNKYFFNHFSNLLNLFRHLPMAPFIWHLTSGPEQGFDCYIIIYKWNKDKLFRLRSIYLEHRERSLINRKEDLQNNESAAAQNEKEKIDKQLIELESFKKKIDELLAEGYDPILDDGVGKNIAPLQEKGILAYEVLNKGQLKKYLNADW